MAKAKTSSKKAKQPEELRLTQLERAELNLTERDWELSIKDIELADAKIRNLTMDFHQKMAALKDMLRNAKVKSEQLALIRNRKLAEIEHRLMRVQPGFSFKDYLEQDDGLLVKVDEKIPEANTTTGSSGAVPDELLV